ncbi:MAG: hypothetical protein ABW208_18365 [Pyrinomonadaceae bacterium]
MCFVLAAASTGALAQTQTVEAPAAAPPLPTQEAGATADEDFELNIDVRRISEKDFHAETAVETDGARGLRLDVGVTLRASDIEVLLRNVRGHVRFRASLAPVLRLLDARRGTPTRPPP